MLEVPNTGEDERHAVLVAARDGVLVVLTASWLSDDSDAVLARLLNGVVPGCRQELTAKSLTRKPEPSSLIKVLTKHENRNCAASHQKERRRR